MLKRFLIGWAKAWIMLAVAGIVFSLIAYVVEDVSPFAGVRVVLETPMFQIMLVVVSLVYAIYTLVTGSKGGDDTLDGPSNGAGDGPSDGGAGLS